MSENKVSAFERQRKHFLISNEGKGSQLTGASRH